MTIVTFIQDFMTYTPPLISEATQLVSKITSIPGKITGKIQLVAQSCIDDTQKQLAQALSESIQIKMDPITLGDVMNGPGERPKYDNTDKSQQKQTEITQIKLNNVQQETTSLWQTMVDEINKKYNEIQSNNALLQTTVAVWPDTVNTIQDPSICGYDKYTVGNIAYNNYIIWLANIFGQDAYSNPKQYFGQKFSTTSYPLQPVLNGQDIVNRLNDTEFNNTLHEYIIKYYKYQTSSKKSERNVAQEYSKYVTFLKEFDCIYPVITTTLNKLQKLAKQEKDLNETIQNQNKPNVFK